MKTIKRILLATDLGERSGEILAQGGDLATQLGAELHVLLVVAHLGDYVNEILHVVSRESDAEALERVVPELEARIAGACADAGIASQVQTQRVLYGPHPHELILAHADEVQADLILLGSHGQSALAEMVVGSVAHKVVIHARTPVLLVPI